MPSPPPIQKPKTRGILCGYCNEPMHNPYGTARVCHQCYCVKIKEIRGQKPRRYIVEFERKQNCATVLPIAFSWDQPPKEFTGKNIAKNWEYPEDCVFIFRDKDNTIELIGDVDGGFQCDAKGNPSKRGNGWCKQHVNGKDFIWFKYRKRERNKSLTKPIAGYTPEVKVDPKRANKMLNRACRKLGFSYLNSIKLINFSDKIPTACWYFNPDTLDEGILVNPAMASRSVNDLMICIQHEVMHRALYRNMRGVKDHEIANIALDACINRVITQNASGTRNKKAMEFFGWVYPEKSRRNIVAIANPTLTPADLRKLPVELAKLWVMIWGGFQDENGKPASEILPPLKNLNPRDLYYRLRTAVNNGAGGKKMTITIDNGSGKGKKVKVWGSPFGKEKSGDKPGESNEGNGRHKDNQAVSTTQGEQMEKAVKKAVSKRSRRGRNIRGGGWCSSYSQNEIEEWMDENILEIDEIEARELEEFARQMQTLNKIEDAKAKIREHLDDHSIQEPFLKYPTQFGTEMIALGMYEPIYPLYNNQQMAGAKKKVAVYLDLSPSMDGTLQYIPKVLDVLDEAGDIEFHTGKGDGEKGGYLFAGSVSDLDHEKLEELRKGKIGFGGCSTCFNAVAKHACDVVQNNDVDLIIMITDGLSRLSQTSIDKFNSCGKTCYSVVLGCEDSGWHDNINAVIKDSRLDQLKGEVLPLVLPRWTEESELPH